LGVSVRWLAFPLHPETPEEGQTLEELFAGRSFNIPEALAHMKTVADAEGLPFGKRTKTYNSRLTQELAKWAEEQGRGDAFHQAAFRAYFADGKNIAKMESLLDIAVSVSLDPNEARRVIEERTYREAVDTDWQKAHGLGITAAPTFLFGNRRLVGAQPYQDLKQFVLHGVSL
jgi:predicted DsbA family dithiol-disulfide isomerase